MNKIAVFALTLTIMVFISMVNGQLTCYDGVSQGENDVSNTLTKSIQCSNSTYACLRSVTTSSLLGISSKKKYFIDVIFFCLIFLDSTK